MKVGYIHILDSSTHKYRRTGISVVNILDSYIVSVSHDLTAGAEIDVVADMYHSVTLSFALVGREEHRTIVEIFNVDIIHLRAVVISQSHQGVGYRRAVDISDRYIVDIPIVILNDDRVFVAALTELSGLFGIYCREGDKIVA